METVSLFFKRTLPQYLEGLPIPDSLDGFAHLKGKEWISLAIFFVLFAIISLALLKLVIPKRKPKKKVNLCLKKEDPKVVDLVEIEDLTQEKVCYCRCWRSEKFPLCDGSHNKHNEENDDNVGPLVIKHRADAKTK